MSPVQGPGSGRVPGRVPGGVPGREPGAEIESERSTTRRAEGASFAGAIAGRPGRPPLALVVFLVAIGALVIAGLGGRDAEPAAGEGPAATGALASASAEPVPTPIPVAAGSPAASPAAAPIVKSEAGSELALTIRRHPETMFVHGDVYPAGVTWVFVNMVNSEGRVAAWNQVSIAGGAGRPAEGKPALRFDVELALPDWSHGPLWVQATAYDASGFVVGQEQLGVWPDGSPMVASHGGAGVDGPPIVTPAADDLGAAPVRLELPADASAPIDGTTLTVRGELQVRADSLTIALVTADRRLLATRAVSTVGVDGGVRPEQSPTFEVRLGIPSPRPTGVGVWLVITAFDGDGAAVGFMRREVVIAPLSSPAP